MDATMQQLEVTGVGQVAINARDVDRAVGFYRDVLGLPLLLRIPDAAFFQCGAVRLMVGRAERPELDHPASILYYRVGDIRAAHGALTARGARFVDEPHLVARLPDHELWMAFLHDSEDNLLAIMAEVRG